MKLFEYASELINATEANERYLATGTYYVIENGQIIDEGRE